jgi:ABC-2 family transporter protein
MSPHHAICAIARADFLERIRRHSFLVMLLFAAYLAYAAATGQISLRLGEYRGVYTSAWIGVMVSLITTTFLTLVGFYIVKNAVDRDRQTGVGEILASTPVSRTAYLLGKFLSNFAVLASMLGVLALAAIAMQFLVAEDRAFHPWALLSPFLLLSVPALALTAALALSFETIGLLRGGFGNVAWFFLWSLAIGLPGAMDAPRFDPSGIWTVYRSVVPAARAAIPGYKDAFSLTVADRSVRVFSGFRWQGIVWTSGEVLLRAAWLAVAVGLVLTSALLFDRFDPAQNRARSAAKPKQRGGASEAAPYHLPASTGTPPTASTSLNRLADGGRSSNFVPVFVAELRLAAKGYRWWWYAVAAGLVIAQAAAPLEVSRAPLLCAAWIWPILIWSALGTREARFGTQQILFSCPRVLLRQLPAAWLAGVAVAALLGAGTALRLVISGQATALFAWAAGALFIPSLALALGVWSGTSRFFEGLYTAIWYVGPLNRVPGFDFSGGGSGPLAGWFAWMYLGISAILLMSAFGRRARQLRGI